MAHCWLAWRPELGPWNLHGRRREQNPKSYPLTSMCKPYMCPPPHTNKQIWGLER